MNLPIDFEHRMKDMLGGEYDEFKKAVCDGEGYTAVRVNTAKKGAAEAVRSVIGESARRVEWCNDAYYIDKDKISGNHPYHMAGLFYFQEPSAMTVAAALDIKEGDNILDLCAAPGGKTTQVGARMTGGLLVANEIVPKRAKVLAENTERFGIKNALVTNESPERLEEYFTSFFDKIIVDAPCSGEGMFRKNSYAAEEWSVAHSQSCAERQLAILNSAEKMLAENGCIVYSTCTFAPCENEGVTDRFLIEHSDFELERINGLDMLSDGVGEWADCTHDMTYAKRVFPHRADGEGHFLALLRRKGGGRKMPKMCEPVADKRLTAAVELYRVFEEKTLNKHIDGNFVLFGDSLYLLPEGIKSVDKLKTVRAGLLIGVCKKGRFEPSHALCLALTADDFKYTAEYSHTSAEIYAYMRGETLIRDAEGWVCVTVDGFPLGWGKGSGGVIKNHFPKHLRLMK